LITNCGFELLPLQPQYILKLEELPYHHRDPFDRILIASALSEKMPIVSVDENFKRYQNHR
jgi:PIN domain nuclease of toxin-antitoxin system